MERQNDALKRVLNSGSSASLAASQARRPAEDDRLHMLCSKCVGVVDGLSDWVYQAVTRWTSECVHERWNEQQMEERRDGLLDELDTKSREVRSSIEKVQRDVTTAAT